VTHQGFVELMLFLAMVIGTWLASYELLFPNQQKPTPTADEKQDG